jgi:hypothetical protein
VKDISDSGQQQIKLIRDKQARDQRLVVSMNDACTMLGFKLTTIRGLIDNGILATVVDGQRRLVLTSSVYDRMVANIARSYPADGGKVKLHKFRGTRPHEKAKAGRAA